LFVCLFVDMGERAKKKKENPLNKQLYADAVRECGNEWELEIGDQVGHGAFSHVYLTTDKNGNKGALKVCILKTRPSYEREYLLREVEVQKKLRDPYLVRLICSEKLEDYVVIHMEYCEMTLTQFTAKCGIETTIPAAHEGRKDIVTHVLDEKTLRPLARDALRGLYHLNRLGYPHRDIKGDNILLSRQSDGSFRAKLADFGMTKSGSLHTMLGTPEFMAPEVRGVQKSGMCYDYRCDVWSMGITFYFALIGEYPFLLANVSCLDSIKYFSLPEVPKGKASTGKPWTPYSPCLRHFVQSLLVRDPEDRLTSEEALQHPFLMPEISHIQLVVPDTSINVLVSRNHKIMSGDIAFNNELMKHYPKTASSKEEAKKIAADSLLSAYPFNRIKWRMTWTDFARRINLGKTPDFLVITDKGKSFQFGDPFTFEEEDTINVVVVPRKTSVAHVDREVLVAMSSEVMKKNAATKGDVNKVLHLEKELNTRYAFCYATKRMEEYVLPLLNFDPIAERLRQRQKEISQMIPSFPVAVFVPPTPVEWKCSMTSEDFAEADALRKEIENCHACAVRQSRKLTPVYTSELKKLNELAKIWVNPVLPSCLEHAIKSFNDILDIVRAHADAINRLLDYLEILDLAEKDPNTASVRLGKLVAGCQYLRVREKAKALLRDDTDDTDDIRVLKEQVAKCAAMIEEATKTNSTLRKQNKELQNKAEEAIDYYKKQISMLQTALQQNGISSDPVYGDIPDTPMQIRRK